MALITLMGTPLTGYPTPSLQLLIYIDGLPYESRDIPADQVVLGQPYSVQTQYWVEGDHSTYGTMRLKNDIGEDLLTSNVAVFNVRPFLDVVRENRLNYLRDVIRKGLLLLGPPPYSTYQAWDFQQLKDLALEFPTELYAEFPVLTWQGGDAEEAIRLYFISFPELIPPLPTPPPGVLLLGISRFYELGFTKEQLISMRDGIGQITQLDPQSATRLGLRSDIGYYLYDDINLFTY